jgi:hypothetical protein
MERSNAAIFNIFTQWTTILASEMELDSAVQLPDPVCLSRWVCMTGFDEDAHIQLFSTKCTEASWSGLRPRCLDLASTDMLSEVYSDDNNATAMSRRPNSDNINTTATTIQ